MARIALPPLPPGFPQTREGMHRLAEDVIKVAREHATGEFSLVRSRGGFGTRLFGLGRQIRVEGTELVVASGAGERRAPISSPAAAADLIGRDDLPEGLDPSTDPLGIEADSAAALAAAFEAGEAILRRLAEGAGTGDEPTEPTLWPEHFDIAIEMGRSGDGLRANYGMSPGDENHPNPYFYVGPWDARPEGDLWNGNGFSGAEISYEELSRAADPVEAAVEFATRRKQALEEDG